MLSGRGRGTKARFKGLTDTEMPTTSLSRESVPRSSLASRMKESPGGASAPMGGCAREGGRDIERRGRKASELMSEGRCSRRDDGHGARREGGTRCHGDTFSSLVITTLASTQLLWGPMMTGPHEADFFRVVIFDGTSSPRHQDADGVICGSIRTRLCNWVPHRRFPTRFDEYRRSRHTCAPDL